MRKELCRNFQRGSCRYGERCRFLHPSQQQGNDKSNAFGFGAQNANNQQQKQNPFGFGVQNNNSQPAGFTNNAFGSNQNQFKPFENKWTRDGATSTHPTSNQSKPTADHICTDPASCKRIIEEDFKNERPSWKLTCYGHFKHLPCDIVGDASFEELRAAAYDDAKRGVNLQSIVERERNQLNSKLVEVDNFLRSPYKGPAYSIPPNQNPVPGFSPNQFPLTSQNPTPTNSFLPTGQNNAAPNSSFPSFGQPGALGQNNVMTNSFIPGFGQPAAPSQNNAAPNSTIPGFGQPGAPLNSGFGSSLSPQVNSSFGQPNAFANFNKPSNAFGVNSSPSFGAGSTGFQTNPPAFGSSFNSNTTGTGNSGINTLQSNQFSTSAPSILNPDTSKSQLQTGFHVPNSSPGTAAKGTTDVQLGINPQKEAASIDPSIWRKEKWNPGEIPEQAPPDAYI